MRWNLSTSTLSSSSARCPLGSMSCRCESSTPRAAERVVRGERSSWLTSDVNRASWRILSCSASAIRLNDFAMGATSRSLVGFEAGVETPAGDRLRGL